MLRWFLPLLGLLVLTACAAVPAERSHQPPGSEQVRCMALYQALNQAVAAKGATPSSPRPIQGFPYLRVDRFLASYRQKNMSSLELQTWVSHLAERDLNARRVEIATLPTALRTDLQARHAAPSQLLPTLESCSLALQNADLASPGRLELLRKRATVPDDYQTLKQVLGLYPVTSLAVRRGISSWHAETLDLFAQTRTGAPPQGGWQRFQPPPATGPTPDTIALDALGIPTPTVAQLQALFIAHAPVWEIDVTGDFDLPGAPYWLADSIPTVDSSRPLVYRYHSYTRWRGAALLQLNYSIWFAARPRGGRFDILGGALDGLVWRVTLGRDGKPILYDTIHPCGCYHLFFPTSALKLRPEALSQAEIPFVPQATPAPTRGERLVVQVRSRDHYIRRVYTDRPSGTLYDWRDYEALYSVPSSNGGRRSLFGPDGLVAGTERGERWLLWPMGIASPGTMRERGRQATAFVGRRHFDDATLLEQSFEEH